MGTQPFFGRNPFLFILYFTAFFPNLQAFCENFRIFVKSAPKSLSDDGFRRCFIRIGDRFFTDGAKAEERGQVANAARFLHHAPSPFHTNGAHNGRRTANATRPNVETTTQSRRDADGWKIADVFADPLLLNGEAEADEQDGRLAGVDDAEQTAVFLAVAVEIAPKATANAKPREFSDQVFAAAGATPS